MKINLEIETLLKKPYYVIDFLPMQVPKNSEGQFFDVEKHYLKNAKKIHNKFTDIILKLNCYYDLEFIVDDKSKINPKPNVIEKIVKSKKYVLVRFDKALITIDKGDLYMTIYNANSKNLKILKDLATSNGLFLWKPKRI
ncbi:MAG: hypothetical protein J6P02_06870 [Lachnospiraceae bacterium]|nr:hypothetical protein [Lachnospiraceae bacterium]